MSNPRNSVSLVGRLANDPRVFTNKDGSKKVSFTLMVDRNYTDKQGSRPSDAIEVEAFVRATTQGTGPFGYAHKGDQVLVAAELRLDRYTQGETEVFKTKVVVQDITFLESKAVSQARLAKRMADTQAENTALQQQVADASAVSTESEFVHEGEPDLLPFG